MRLVPSRIFSIEGQASWEPDLIGFLRQATETAAQAALDLTVSPHGGTASFTFTDHTIRTTGDLGSSFVEQLRTVLAIYA